MMLSMKGWERGCLGAERGTRGQYGHELIDKAPTIYWQRGFMGLGLNSYSITGLSVILCSAA